MIAYRTTWMVKLGKMDEVIEFLSHTIEQSEPSEGEARAYTPDMSPSVFVYEEVWASVEAHDAFWEKFNARPGADAFWRAWNELVERQVSTYRWNVKVWR